ncbi:MAG: O-antigen ligase family protein [Rhizobacter sp.]|nr:O-antigen ligase family protein [Rhizobacter sp.]
MTSAALAPRRRWAWALPAGLSIGAVWWLATFPVAQVPIGLSVLAAVSLVAWRPVLLFAVVAAALPVLDLAPWSGRRAIDEFDLLLVLGLAIAWARTPRPAASGAARSKGTGTAIAIAIAIAMAGLLVATCRALWPWAPPEADAFGNPLNPFNALRLTKGGCEAAALWWFACRLRDAGRDPVGAFADGMVAGLTATVICVVVERLAFAYLLDFSSDYRVSGPFSAMSLGGAYVECYLAIAAPFLLSRLMPPVAPLRFAGGAALLAATSYALMVTYSRGGYLAMVVGVTTFVLALASASVLTRRTRLWRAASGLALAALAASAAYPILNGEFAQRRLETVSADLGTRQQHWSESLQAMDKDLETQLFGMGLGSFAEVNYWRGPEGHRAGGHRLLTAQDGRPALRLGSGYAYFVEQIVDVRPGERYRLSYRTRHDMPDAGVGVVLCQKWIITSFDCARGQPPERAAAPTPIASAAWQPVARDVVAPDAGPGRLPRPVRLSLQNDSSGPVDVRDVSLISTDGIEHIENGEFTAGMDHWTFTSDHHLAWHAKSMPLSIYFEQGLLGVAGLVSLLVAGLWRAASAARQGRVEGAAMLAAMCAFSIVGLIDTLVDTPRFLLLWMLLCTLPSALPRGGRPASD